MPSRGLRRSRCHEYRISITNWQKCFLHVEMGLAGDMSCAHELTGYIYRKLQWQRELWRAMAAANCSTKRMSVYCVQNLLHGKVLSKAWRRNRSWQQSLGVGSVPHLVTGTRLLPFIHIGWPAFLYICRALICLCVLFLAVHDDQVQQIRKWVRVWRVAGGFNALKTHVMYE